MSWRRRFRCSLLPANGQEASKKQLYSWHRMKGQIAKNQHKLQSVVLISSTRQYSRQKPVDGVPLEFCSPTLTCFCSHLCFCPFVVYQSHADRSLLPVWLSHVAMPVPLTQLAVFPKDSSEAEFHKTHTNQSLYLVDFFKDTEDLLP